MSGSAATSVSGKCLHSELSTNSIQMPHCMHWTPSKRSTWTKCWSSVADHGPTFHLCCGWTWWTLQTTFSQLHRPVLAQTVEIPRSFLPLPYCIWTFHLLFPVHVTLRRLHPSLLSLDLPLHLPLYQRGYIPRKLFDYIQWDSHHCRRISGVEYTLQWTWIDYKFLLG